MRTGSRLAEGAGSISTALSRETSLVKSMWIAPSFSGATPVTTVEVAMPSPPASSTTSTLMAGPALMERGATRLAARKVRGFGKVEVQLVEFLRDREDAVGNSAHPAKIERRVFRTLDLLSRDNDVGSSLAVRSEERRVGK